MDPFHDNRWDYFNSITVGEEIITERKLSIFFNDDGVVDSWVLEKLSDN
jgi:outer membrane protein assembly factor BamE